LPFRSDKIRIVTSKPVGWLPVLFVALSVRPVPLSAVTWVHATNLAILASAYRSTDGAQSPSPPAAPTNVRIVAGASTGTTIFFDDFVGTSIDSAKWTVYDRLSDQANGEVNCVIPQNVSVNGGLLSGVSKFEDRVCGDSVEPPKTMHYTSWQIAQATAPFLYGTIEVRAKIPGGTGLWPCIWMLGFKWQASQPFTANTPEHNWPHDGWSEVDIAEFMGNSRTTVNNQVHFESANVGPGFKNLPFDATTRFMVYRLQWQAGSMIWSVDAEDGKGYQSLSSLSGSSVPNVPMYVIIHTAIGGVFGGTPNPTTFPQTFQVDWVRITQ
jgi:beta-glucanase (GH16 family)